MKLQQFAVHRPITVAMCVAALFVFGLVSIGRMGLELLPNLSYPVVAVVTVYPNADPTTVERELTQPIEGAVATLAGLRRLESTSMEHASLVVAQFDWGTDLGDAMEQMNAAFNVLAASFPSDAQRPLVVKMDPDQLPLMLIGMTGSGDPAELTQEADLIVRPALERLPGVAQVSILGGVRPEITVYYDLARLREEWLTPLHLQQLLMQQNALVPAGSFTASPAEIDQWNRPAPGDDWFTELPSEASDSSDTPLRYRVRVGHPLRSAEDVGDLVVGRRRTAGQEAMGFAALLPQLVRIRDVATVEAGYAPTEGFTRVNGESAIVLRVLKQSGENSVEVASQVRARIAELATTTSAGTSFFVITDQSDLITQSVSNLSTTALVGGVLAVLVLFAFLRNVRSIVIIAFSIPFSIIVAIIIMYFSGLSLNIMTLGGLALGIGLVVDNSIVVLENIFRHRSEGKDVFEAAKIGAAEVASAITAATLTTVAVFLPLVFVESIAGHLFRDLAITVACAVVGSLFVALIVVPALAAHLPGRKLDAAVTQGHSGGGFYGRLQRAYTKSLRWSLGRPALTVGMIVVCGIGLIVLPGQLKLELLPPMDGGMVSINLTLPPGTPVEETNAVAQQIESTLLAYPEVSTVAVYVGPQGGDDFVSLVQEAPVHQAQITALLTPRSQRALSAHQLAANWREQLPVPPGGELHVSADRVLDALGDEFAMAVTIEVSGPELEQIEEYAAQVVEGLRALGGFGDIVTSADRAQPELVFQVNPDRALLGGLTAGQIGLSMRAALTGLPATQIYVDGVTVPVVLRPSPADVADLERLSDLRIPSLAASGFDMSEPPPTARFGTLADPEISTAPANIRHVDRQRVVTVTAQFDGIDLSEAGRRAESVLAGIQPERGYELRLAGIHDTMKETVSDMGLALALAVIFVYMAMAAQFESLRQPFVVMFTVPLAAVGAMVGLWLSGEYLSIPSMMGLITLCGIAVNNGIVLVDAINRLRGSGMARIEAIVEAGRIRLRPILMTTLTTVIGLLPLAFRWGEGTELQAPLAVSVIWGLVLSTILTLFVVPSVYLMTAGRTKPKPSTTTGALPS